jgi:Ni/Co efflux regulator RcnB
MRTIMLAVAAAAVAFTAAPLLGHLSAQAQGIQTAQVDVQVGPNRDRDRDRDVRRDRDRDRDLTIGVGPGGVKIGPRERCRTVTTTVEREGRQVTTRERKCD